VCGRWVVSTDAYNHVAGSHRTIAGPAAVGDVDLRRCRGNRRRDNRRHGNGHRGRRRDAPDAAPADAAGARPVTAQGAGGEPVAEPGAGEVPPPAGERTDPDQGTGPVPDAGGTGRQWQDLRGFYCAGRCIVNYYTDHAYDQ